MRDFESCHLFFIAFRTISKDFTVVGIRRRQLKKWLFILFGVNFRFFLT